MINNVWTCVRIVAYILVVLAVVLCANGKIYLGCMFFEEFGIICPTCGATRATLAMLRGNIISAIEYNAFYSLVILPFVIFLILEDLYVIITRCVFKKTRISLIEVMFGGKV